MLEDISLMGKMQTTDWEFNPEPVDLQSFCLDLLEEIHRVVKDKKRIALSYLGEDRKVLIDRELLRLCLTNLISNALKYQNEMEEVRVELDIQPDQTVLELKIKALA